MGNRLRSSVMWMDGERGPAEKEDDSRREGGRERVIEAGRDWIL